MSQLKAKLQKLKQTNEAKEDSLKDSENIKKNLR